MTRFSPTMTSNVLPSPFVADASTTWTVAHPYKAFDQTNDYWLTNNTASGWLELDIGSGNSELLYAYSIRVNAVPEPNRAPKDWTIQGSNTGAFSGEEATLDTVTGETSWGDGERRWFVCDTVSTAYRYFRLNVTDNNGDAYLQMGEWELFSTAPVMSPTSGAFTTSQLISMSSVADGVDIYYTTDGSTPDSSSTLYSSPLILGVAKTIKAIAILSGTPDSEVISNTYTVIDPSQRYWRILNHYRQGTGVTVGIAELEMRESEGGSDVTGSGTVSASSENSASYLASYAFDGNTSTRWLSSNSAWSESWLKYDFGSGNEKDIVEVVLTSGTTADIPTDFELQYSSDDITWHTKFIWLDSVGWSTTESRTFNVSTTNTYRTLISPHLMISNIAPEPYIATADTTGFNPSEAFDMPNKVSTYWLTNSASTGWLSIDLGYGNIGEATTFGWQNNTVPEPTRMPKNFTLQGSRNGVSWDTLYTGTDETSWGDEEVRFWEVTNPGTYRHYKVDITLNNGSSYTGGAMFYVLADLPPEATVLLPTYNNKKRITNHTNLRR